VGVSPFHIRIPAVSAAAVFVAFMLRERVPPPLPCFVLWWMPALIRLALSTQGKCQQECGEALSHISCCAEVCHVALTCLSVVTVCLSWQWLALWSRCWGMCAHEMGVLAVPLLCCRCRAGSRGSGSGECLQSHRGACGGPHGAHNVFLCGNPVQHVVAGEGPPAGKKHPVLLHGAPFEVCLATQEVCGILCARMLSGAWTSVPNAGLPFLGTMRCVLLLQMITDGLMSTLSVLADAKFLHTQRLVGRILHNVSCVDAHRVALFDTVVRDLSCDFAMTPKSTFSSNRSMDRVLHPVRWPPSPRNPALGFRCWHVPRPTNENSSSHT
jgi:hypothetical protein